MHPSRSLLQAAHTCSFTPPPPPLHPPTTSPAAIRRTTHHRNTCRLHLGRIPAADCRHVMQVMHHHHRPAVHSCTAHHQRGCHQAHNTTTTSCAPPSNAGPKLPPPLPRCAAPAPAPPCHPRCTAHHQHTQAVLGCSTSSLHSGRTPAAGCTCQHFNKQHCQAGIKCKLAPPLAAPCCNRLQVTATGTAGCTSSPPPPPPPPAVLQLC